MRDTAHHNLPGFGMAGQAKLADARVLCIGAGGLACGALPYLASMGVGTIGLVDDDTVSLGNLPRQPLYTPADIGQPKAMMAAQRLQALHPSLHIQPDIKRFTHENALNWVDDYDIILDCSDNFATKYLINAVALHTGKPWVYGAALGWQGQVATFIPQQTACYRCWLPEPPAQVTQNCSEAGVLAVLPGIIGTLQAQQLVALILSSLSQGSVSKDTQEIGANKHLSIRNFVATPDEVIHKTSIHLIDSQQLRLQSIQLPPNPQCVCQLRDPARMTVMELLPVAEKKQQGMSKKILPELAMILKEAVWIDVREKHEWDKGHAANAWHWPLSAMQAGNWPAIDPSQPVILYCQYGSRSDAAQSLWQRQASCPAELYSLIGGYSVIATLGNLVSST